MLPAHYFEVICCPRCWGDLSQVSESKLICLACAATFPVVEDIPVLLEATDDEVSQTVSAFYRQTWAAELAAGKRTTAASTDQDRVEKPLAHDDPSPLGQTYVRVTERREAAVLGRGDGPKRFFLDAACGGFPRKSYGKQYAYHVCMDFALPGLVKAKEILGDRAVCVCGSLLKAPLRSAVFDGVLASHCVYHIDKDLQAMALRELVRVLAPAGRLVVFYANPENVASRLLFGEARQRLLSALFERARKRSPPPKLVHDVGPTVYCYLHPIDYVRQELAAVHPDATVAVRSLCLLPFDQRAPLFQERGFFAAFAYAVVMRLEKRYVERPELSYYLAYHVERSAAGRPGPAAS